MPTPGDVNLVLAAELMEGGRAIGRGLVTPDRTTLITSSHRSYAISEKSAPGNGITDPNDVLDAGRNAAKRFYCLDLQAMADTAEERRVGKECGSTCSSRWQAYI